MLLYASRARYVYECTLCKTPIGKRQLYLWGDPSPKARYIDKMPRQYVCCKCADDREAMKVFWAKWKKTKPERGDQLALTLDEPRRVKFITALRKRC